MKILAFAGSNSSKSINKQLITHTVNHYFSGHNITILDLNDYEMPIFSQDRQDSSGIPAPAKQFAEKIDDADFIIISLAEHNGAYSAAFKNIFDWISVMPNRSVFQDKPVFLMATSNGARGGASVLSIAEARFPWNGGKVINTFSLPKFNENFIIDNGITNPDLKLALEEKIHAIKAYFN